MSVLLTCSGFKGKYEPIRVQDSLHSVAELLYVAEFITSVIIVCSPPTHFYMLPLLRGFSMFCALEYDRAKPKNSFLVGQELYFAWRSSVTKESRRSSEVAELRAYFEIRQSVPFC